MGRIAKLMQFSEDYHVLYSNFREMKEIFIPFGFNSLYEREHNAGLYFSG